MFIYEKSISKNENKNTPTNEKFNVKLYDIIQLSLVPSIVKVFIQIIKL